MDTQKLNDAYFSLLRAFVDSQDEQHLAQAADLGRQLVLANTPVEDIAEIHENAIARLGDEYPDKTLLESAKRISAPLMELLMAYGLAFRERDEEHERSVAALRESEEKYRSIFLAAASVMMSVDPEGVIVECNARVAELLGYGREQMVGRRLAALIHPNDASAFQESVKAVLAGVPQYASEYRMIKEDETAIDVSLDAAPQRNLEGKLVRIVCIISDITERKLLEAQLRHAARMEAVGQLAGGIAHDFNNILTGIKGYTGLLLRDAEEGSGLARDLAEVDGLADRAAGLTRQLLAFSRRQTLEVKEVGVNGLIGKMTGMLRRVIGEDIEIAFRASADLWKVEADAGQIEQVVMNLAVNARDAMPEGGKLTIATSNERLDETDAAVQAGLPAGAYVRLTVTDTGSGMDVASMERIFEPFYTTKGTDKGTGLGLSTAYGIVKQHKGEMRVKSTPGEGTTFDIYLPRSKEGGGGKRMKAEG